MITPSMKIASFSTILSLFAACAAWSQVAAPAPVGKAPAAVGPAAVGPAPAVAKEPLLRLEAGGPTADVATLAFSPDGKTLYAAGWDKVVRVWKLEPNGQFVAQREAFRVPIGPGLSGAINAMALSEDGRWLAVGGTSTFQGQAGFQRPGLVVASSLLTPSMWEDVGTIFVFETSKPDQVYALRSHRGDVRSLAFVRGHGGAAPLLVSAASDLNAATGRNQGGLRLWDVVAKTSLAEFNDLPDPGVTLPGLTAWKTGDQTLQVHVAIAWDDADVGSPGTLRVWDVERKLLHRAGDGSKNNAVAFVSDGGSPTLLTTSFMHPDGRVNKFAALPHEAPRYVDAQAVFEWVKPGSFFYPRALAMTSSRGDGALDHAAVALRVFDGAKAEYRLQLISLKDGRRSAEAPLWLNGRVPVLATSPRGSHVAVAGSSDHSIHVYSVQGLLAGNALPQVLRSIAMRPGDAAFVKQVRDGKTQLGIVFAENAVETRGANPRGIGKRDMIFDIDARRLIAADLGWTHDTPPLAGWAAFAEAAAVTVRSPAGADKRIALPAGWQLSDFALLPPNAKFKQPLLALASHAGNSPRFSLFNASTGEQLIEFTGHLNKIRSVAFSGDGRFLITASDDQTISVWSLNKLDEFMGAQGQIHNLLVQVNEANKLVVTGHSTAMGEAGLRKGDVIESLLREDGAAPVASPLELQNAVLKIVPRDKNGNPTTATLKLGDGRQVRVAVGQAIQQRTPLMMLFVTHGGRPEEREWLGWNPIGPYDSSDPKVVRSFGWHFNPAKQGDAVQFTSAEKDLPKERREGLLRHLIARASLVPALEDYDNERKAKPLPPPEMTMVIDGMKDGIVRRENVNVGLRATGIAADRVESVRWSVGVEPQALSADVGIEHSRAFKLARGKHVIKAILRTREDVPQEFVKTIDVRYVPEAPSITPTGEAANLGDKVLEVSKPVFKLSAKIKPGAAGEKPVVQLYHQQAALDKEPLTTNAVDRDITLKPGHNQIEVQAQHEATRQDNTEEIELVRLVLNIKYTPPEPPKDAPLPVIVLEAVVPVLEGGEVGERQPILRKGTPVVVNSSKIRIIGKILTPSRLALAEWGDGERSNALRFEREAPGAYFLDQPLTLPKTGRQTITIRARSMPSEAGQKAEIEERLLQIDYRPSLPVAASIHAQPADKVVFDQGSGSPEIQITGTLLHRQDSSKAAVTAKCVVTTKDGENAFDAKVDALVRSWTAKIRLSHGSNLIQVRLNNGLQESLTGNLRIDFRRPPLNLRAAVPPKTADPLMRMEAYVDSVLPLSVDSIHATVGGKDVRNVFLVKPMTPQDNTWKIHFNVPLRQGNNEIRLVVANDDGAADTLVRKVDFQPKKALPPAPTVAFVQPAISDAASDLAMSVTRPKFPLQYNVSAVSTFKRVALSVRREGQKPQIKEFDLAEVKKTDKGFGIPVQTDLDLAPGISWISLEVEDQDQRVDSRELVVNYIPPPVRLFLETLESRDGKGGSQPVAEGADGKWTTAAAPNAKLWLTGKVVWTEKDSLLTDKQLVSVFVNGSQQWRGELDPPTEGSLSRRFKAEILLNRDKGNDIEVELPSLKLADNRRSNVTVDCERPRDEQWLHVQIVSPGDSGDTGESKLMDQVLKSLQGTDFSKESGEFKRPGFERARLYPPLITGVDYDKLAERLLSIRREIAQRSREGWPNDVVLIYFSGGETVDQNGRTEALIQTASSQTVITRDQIAKQFSDMLGVKVLLLDVHRPRTPIKTADLQAQRQIARWLESPTRHAWIRAAWLDSDAPPKENRLLLTALQDAMTKADLLGDLPAQVGRQLAERFPNLQADWYLPQALHGLSLREKK